MSPRFPAENSRIEILESRIAPAFAAILDLSALTRHEGFHINGDGSDDRAGFSVSGAGDVNGDGFGDFIIGAFRADPNGTDSGAAYVLFGKAGGFGTTVNLPRLDGTDGFRINGETPDDLVGSSVSGAGDVNGDGFDDLLIGAAGANPYNRFFGGASYVVFGKATGFGANFELSTLDGANGFQIDGEAAGDKLGHSVSSAGDVNGDGFADIIVGANWADPNGSKSGASYVIFGKANGFAARLNLSTLTGANGFQINGEAADDYSGQSVSGAGDVNGDGFDDLLIGANWADPNGSKSGASYVVFGKASGFGATLNLSTLTGPNGFQINGEAAGDYSGWSVSGAGDVNGDGFDDLVIGALFSGPNGSKSGASYVVFGKASGFAATLNLSTLNGANGFKLLGEALADRSGGSVSGAGDVNGDGFDDILVGAASADSNENVASGVSYVIFGKASGFDAALSLSALDGANGFQINGETDSDFAGRSVSGAGDVNGDGFDDILIGAYGPYATVSYMVFGKGDAPAPTTIIPAISADGMTATFTDVDGDLVTVKITGGIKLPDRGFNVVDFHILPVEGAVHGGGQLASLDLGFDFTFANLSITATPGPLGGNGFVNVGFLNAAEMLLGTVTIGGDLGRLEAGRVSHPAGIPALQALTVQSIGLLGASTQEAGIGPTTGVNLEGALPKLLIKGDLRASFSLNGPEGKLGAATIAGSIHAAEGPLEVSADAGITALAVGGNILSTGFPVSIVSTQGAIGKLTVLGSITSTVSPGSVAIRAFGQPAAPVKGSDLAIGTIDVRGSVEFTTISAGAIGTGNADASIGSILVGRDWLQSSVLAGVAVGGDGQFGTADDEKISGAEVRDTAQIRATIGNLTIKGQALGSPDGGDMFGVVAEQITKAKIGARTFALKAGTSEPFFAAPTGAGTGAENPAFDFTIRELGAATPTVAFGGPNLVIATNGKSATFTDVDGDLVTVKRSAGTFLAADFNITTEPSGGGQLRTLTLSAAPGNAPIGLTITAKPAVNGGNGFVNVGSLGAGGVALGTVSIAGDLGHFVGGDGVGAKPGTAAFTVRSLGALGTSTGAPGSTVTFADGVGKLTVLGDVWSSQIAATDASSRFDAISIGGSLRGSVQADGDIASVKIGGSMIGGSLRSGATIGAITIGGDLIGLGAGATIEAFGKAIAPAKGLDLAIKSIAVKGNVERASITTGLNADGAIGAISIGREWIASSVATGVVGGLDGFLGTADDTKLAGGGVRDEAARFSSIASILIKGQAIGTPAGGDHRGIVTEFLGKVQIGAVKFTLDPGERDAADAFAAAPTGPGAPGLASDFFVREISA